MRTAILCLSKEQQYYIFILAPLLISSFNMLNCSLILGLWFCSCVPVALIVLYVYFQRTDFIYIFFSHTQCFTRFLVFILDRSLAIALCNRAFTRIINLLPCHHFCNFICSFVATCCLFFSFFIIRFNYVSLSSF